MESGSPAMLKYLKKGTVTKEKIQNAVKAGIDNGLEVLGSFMIGIPGETEKDMLMTYDFIKELRLTGTGINVATPFPGTELWNYAVDKGYIKDEWDESIYAMKTITPETIKDKQLLCSIDKKRFIDIYKNMLDLDSMLVDRLIRIRTLKEIVFGLYDKSTPPLNKLKMLDINCEDGTLGAAIKAKADVEVVGLNPDMDYIMDCDRRLDKVIRGGIDELKSEYEDGYFDLIIFNELLSNKETIEHYNKFLCKNGIIAGSFVNSNHFSYQAYSLLGINRPLFETTDGTFQYLNWGIPDKEKFSGSTLKDLQCLMEDGGYNLTSLYDFKSLENNLTRKLCNSSVNESSADNPENESLVIRYFYSAKKIIVTHEVNKENKKLINNNHSVIQENKRESYENNRANEVENQGLADLVPDNAQRILHIGCKQGEVGKDLLTRGAEKVVGVNSNSTICEKARENLSEILCGSIEKIDLPYDKGYFDCIIIDNTLEYLKDPLYALNKLKNYLSDSGAAIAIIPNTGNIHKINALVNGQWNSDDINNSNDTPLRFFTRKEIGKLFAEAGFELTGLSAGLMSPEYHDIDVTASKDVAVGRVLLKGLNPEEIRDIYTVNYLIRSKKKGMELKNLNALVDSFMIQGKMAEAKQAVEEYLELHLADTAALYLHADICVKQGSFSSAMESIDKIILFDPENEKAIKLKIDIQKTATIACPD
jgi:2-polyprenyl-3-methyl-5-hydroxy-6-metoxy-1,4-benzoquinol methylase